MWFYILITLIFVIIIYVLITYNMLTKMQNRIEEAFFTMDVYLKKRWDLIPNLVEIVKGYTDYENKTLNEIILMRNENYSIKDKESIDKKITQNIKELIILAENYPDLKADKNYKELSNQLTKVEDEIANARKYYNGTIRIMNNKIEMFPSNIVAKLFGFKVKNMFEVNEKERQNVKVEL